MCQDIYDIMAAFQIDLMKALPKGGRLLRRAAADHRISGRYPAQNAFSYVHVVKLWN